jgi:predicted nucleotidyltransferase
MPRMRPLATVRGTVALVIVFGSGSQRNYNTRTTRVDIVINLSERAESCQQYILLANSLSQS